MTQTEIDAENQRVKGYKSPKVKPSAGDGEEVPVPKAFDELRKMNGAVIESGSHDFHKKIWQGYIGNKGEPPLAFKYAGRIRIDIEKLSPEQRKIWIELDRAQTAKIKGEPAKGGGNKGGGQGSDDNAHAKKGTDAGTAKTDPAPPPKKGGGTDVGTAKTQPGSPPPPHSGDTAKVKPSPGDGQEVPIKQAFEQLGKMDGVVIESGSHDFHKKIWNEYLGNKGEPPLAFKYANRIRVDIEKLTPEQRKQWIALDQAQTAKIKGNTGETKGGASNKQGQKVHEDVADYSARVKKYNDKLDDFNKRKDQFDVTLEKQGHAADLDKAAKLDKEAAQLEKESKSLLTEGEGLSKELQTAGAKELEAAFKTSDAKGLLEAAHRGSAPKGAPEVEFIANTAVMLANAYFVVQSISYILDADNALDAVARIGEVGVNVAVGAEEAAIFEIVTGSTPVGLILGMVVGMCGDQAGACEEQERQEREKAQEKAERKALNMAVGKYLEKNFPGSVEYVEDAYVVHNRPLWDATVKKIAELKKLKEIEQQKKMQEEMQKVHRIKPEDINVQNQPHMDPA